jgi:hypothetical protein
MLFIIVRLKKGHALEELVDDAADGPDVARLGPPEFEDHFRSPVVTRRDHRRMVLVIESRGTEIYESDSTVAHLIFVLVFRFLYIYILNSSHTIRNVGWMRSEKDTFFFR